MRIRIPTLLPRTISLNINLNFFIFSHINFLLLLLLLLDVNLQLLPIRLFALILYVILLLLQFISHYSSKILEHSFFFQGNHYYFEASCCLSMNSLFRWNLKLLFPTLFFQYNRGRDATLP